MLGDESKVGSSGGTFPKASLGRKLGAEIVERVNTERFFFSQVADKEQQGEQISPVLLISLLFRPCVLLIQCLMESDEAKDRGGNYSVQQLLQGQ